VSYILTAILGAVFQHEQVTPARWIGIAVISFGVLLVGRTTAHTTDEPPTGARP
jgi:drug/metabolite transporter (DMT)-like permease